jgi:hypothetical protein
MVSFMNLKVKMCHKFGLKITNHKKIFPNIHKDHTNFKNMNNVSIDPRTRAQELKIHYQSYFVQNSGKKYIKCILQLLL